jgi:hypothetical protein
VNFAGRRGGGRFNMTMKVMATPPELSTIRDLVRRGPNRTLFFHEWVYEQVKAHCSRSLAKE